MSFAPRGKAKILGAIFPISDRGGSFIMMRWDVKSMAGFLPSCLYLNNACRIPPPPIRTVAQAVSKSRASQPGRPLPGRLRLQAGRGRRLSRGLYHASKCSHSYFTRSMSFLKRGSPRRFSRKGSRSNAG